MYDNVTPPSRGLEARAVLRFRGVAESRTVNATGPHSGRADGRPMGNRHPVIELVNGFTDSPAPLPPHCLVRRS